MEAFFVIIYTEDSQYQTDLMNIIDELDNFIENTTNTKEMKRALAAKMKLSGQPSKKIEEILNVSSSFVSQWKNKAIFEGVESLNLQYKGSKGYLKPEEKTQITSWIRQQEYLRLSDLKRYLQQEYNVIYSSNQSYYDLLKAAGMSWKKSQKKNPAKDEKLVKKKEEEIQKKLKDWEEDIKAGKLAVFMIDECHLLWGDVLGFVWGRKDIRVEIPIKNQKSRQSYYGALDYQTHEFILQEYPKADTDNTIQFIQYLREQRPGQKLAIFWDGARYHDSQQFRDFLKELNEGLEEDEWLITCTKFAPNAPEQNPVEDIWLQTKNFLRTFYFLCDSFKRVKELFKIFADGQVFDFPKLYSYGFLPQMT
jgi:transposase